MNVSAEDVLDEPIYAHAYFSRYWDSIFFYTEPSPLLRNNSRRIFEN